MTTWNWQHLDLLDSRTYGHAPLPRAGGISVAADGNIVTSCARCDLAIFAEGGQAEPISIEPSPGYWSVEDGQPYWVDEASGAHFHPGSLRGLDEATQRHAWSTLAEIIWNEERMASVEARL